MIKIAIKQKPRISHNPAGLKVTVLENCFPFLKMATIKFESCCHFFVHVCSLLLYQWSYILLLPKILNCVIDIISRWLIEISFLVMPNCDDKHIQHHLSDPWVRKIPWRRKWQPTPVLLPGKFHGWRSLVGYSA